MQRVHAMSARRLLALVLSMAVTLLAGLAGTARAGQFGIAAFDQQITSDASGDVFTQAGGHPYEITTEIELNHHTAPLLKPEADTKDLYVDLPPGLFGNPEGLPQCTDAQLAGVYPPGLLKTPECPIGSVVGTVHLMTTFPSMTYPIYNMVPPVGEPAEFGFSVVGEAITFYGTVRNSGDFGIRIASRNIPNGIPISGLKLTFWGNPSDSSHDAQRCDWALFGYEFGGVAQCPGEPGTPTGPNADPVQPKAFLTLPGSCTNLGEGFKTTLTADSWPNPGVFAERSLSNHLPPGYPSAPSEWGPQQQLTGCELEPFEPNISVKPTNSQADSPSGLNVDIGLPQDGLINPAGVSTADVKKAVVTLPPGESVSPAAADGLGACSLAQIGLHTGEPARCPDDSKLGTVEIDTPLLHTPLKGQVYLGKQGENPFGSLIAMYIVVEGHGVILKLPGRVDLDPVTGRIVTTFDNNPQLPFNHLRLNFTPGPRSPLVNPHECGTYTTTAELTPWSGQPPLTVSSSFEITSGPQGKPCPNARQFAPGFAIGTTSNQAGGFSPLSLTMTRADGDEQLGEVAMKTPSGLLGTLSSVALCPEPQASEGTCGAESQIGTVTAGAGAGANPFFVRGGRVYITGPYKGSPFGLSVVVPAKAGPFDLGTVVVRGTISVDPHTASLTVTTDPVPTILQGIPLDLRTIHVSIDRPGFIFNPTNCDPQAITGVLTGGLGDALPVVSHFQVTNCASLGFKPSFKVSTNGKTSRADGASLDAKLSYPKGAFGKQANIAKVKVSLPRQLPSRLQTLQKACPGEVFEANPASCPVASKIGTATANTPILPVPLSGPVYFVSHGGAAFPDLVVVLQGYNVTVQLVGNTFISKGITSTTFNTIPDVPVETFELKLPQGKDSALAANGNLCMASLKMPTLFVAQDGTVIKRSTPITPTGCPKHKPHHKKHRKHKRSKKK